MSLGGVWLFKALWEGAPWPLPCMALGFQALTSGAAGSLGKGTRLWGLLAA